MEKNYTTGLVITGNAKGGVSAVKATREQLDALNSSQQRGSRFARSYRSEMRRATEAITGTTRAMQMARRAVLALGGTAGVAKVVTEFREFETGLVGVGKTADLQGRELDKFGTSVTNMSLRIPIATQELLGIAQAAGQLGVEGSQNLLKFTETVARLGTASDLKGSEAATQLARILTVTGEGVDNFDKFASVIVALGNSFAASEAEIAAMTNEVARSTAQFELTAAEAAAIGVALRQMGVRAESGGSAVGRSFLAIDEAINGGGEALEALQQITGLTVDQLERRFATDAAGVFQEFVAGLGRVQDSGGDLASTLELMGLKGQDILKVIPAIAGSSDQLARALEMAAAETENATALTTESERAFETLDADLQTFVNTMDTAARVMGGQLAPSISGAISEFTGLLDTEEKVIGAMGTLGDAGALLASVWFARKIPAITAAISAQVAATAQTYAYASAQAKLTQTSLAAAGAVTGLRTAMGLLGGPAGTVLVAAAAVLTFGSNSAQAAEDADTLSSKVAELASNFERLTEAERQHAVLLATKSIAALKAEKAVLESTLEASENYVRGGVQLNAEQQSALAAEIGETNRQIAEQEQLLRDMQEALSGVNQLQEIHITAQRITAGALQGTSDKTKTLLEQLEFEHSIMGLSNREREIAIALRRFEGDITADQAAEIRRLVGEMYDYAEAQHEVGEQAKQLSREADPFAEAWISATERIDAAFADAWKGAFNSFDDFSDRLKDAFQQLLAELIHAATTKQIIFNMGLAGSGAFSGSGAGGSGGAGISLSDATSLGSLASMLGSGAATGIASAASPVFQALRLVSPDAAASFGTQLGTYISDPMQALQAAGLGIVGAYGGDLIAQSLFDREQATGGLLGGVGATIGAFTPLGPLGALLGGAAGSLIDRAIGDSDFSGKRVKFGVTAGGREEGGFDFSETAASGLELGLISRRTDDVGLDAQDKRAVLDIFLGLDEALTGIATAAGSTIDLTGAVLSNPNPRAYDGGTAPDDFFGSLGKGGVSEEELRAAPAEFVKAWFAATRDQFSEELQQFIDTLDGTAEEMISAFADEVDLISMRENFHNLFVPIEELQQQQFTAEIEALQQTFEALTGRALPNTREELQAYIETIDLSNDELVRGVTQLSPSLNQYLLFMEEIGEAMRANSAAARELADELDASAAASVDWVAFRADEVLQGYNEELDAIRAAHRERLDALEEEARVGRGLLQAMRALHLSDVSPLTNQQRFDFAQNEFARLQVLAESGDLDAAGQLGRAAQDLLSEGANMYASSAPFQSLFHDVTGVLQELGISLGGNRDIQAEIAQLDRQMIIQVTRLRQAAAEQLGYLADMANDTGDIAGLLGSLPEELGRVLAAIIGESGGADGGQGGAGTGAPSGGGLRDPLRDLYVQGLGREPDQEGYAYWASRLANGEAFTDIVDDFVAAASGAGETFTAFATGGVVRSPTVGLFGEAGPEMIIPLNGGAVPVELDRSLVSALEVMQGMLYDLHQDLRGWVGEAIELSKRNVQETTRVAENIQPVRPVGAGA